MWANEELLKKVREWEGGEAVWKNSRNELGYTPEDLWEDGKQTEREQWKTFWEDGDATSERILLSSNPFSMV
jgi:hypothetical protein